MHSYQSKAWLAAVHAADAAQAVAPRVVNTIGDAQPLLGVADGSGYATSSPQLAHCVPRCTWVRLLKIPLAVVRGGVLSQDLRHSVYIG